MNRNQKCKVASISERVFGVIEAAHTTAEWDAIYAAAIAERAAFAAKYAAHHATTGKELAGVYLHPDIRVAAYGALVPALRTALEDIGVTAGYGGCYNAVLSFDAHNILGARTVGYGWAFFDHSMILHQIQMAIAEIAAPSRY